MRKLIIPAALALIAAGILATGITLAALGGGPAGIPGSYPVELNLQSDLCGHDPFIWGQSNHPPHNIKLTVVVDAGFISIQGPAPWVKVASQNFPGSGNQFTANGSGTVAGFPNVQVSFTGVLNGTTIVGKYAFGSESAAVGQGGLPPCGPAGAQVPHVASYGVKPKPTTPTRTPTPHKLFSIIVLKLNSANNQPLAGFDFNLFPGTGCQGNSLLSRTSGDRGLADFTNLEPGTYSVREKAEPGWNVVGDPCQTVQVPGGGVAGSVIPACPIQPDADFPLPGCDTFQSGARVIVEINATQQQFPVTLNGPTQIVRLNAPHKVALAGGARDSVDTEMVFMELTGSSPLGTITVRESDSRHSLGAITEQVNNGPGEMTFPADSFFDVFFDVQIPQLGVTLHNEQPFHVQCKIDEVPPILCFYQPPIGDPIVLVNADGVKVAKIIHALHIPLPPNETLVVFTNTSKLTPTATVTPTRTPTATPHSDVTSTPTPFCPPAVNCTPTPTRTPTPCTLNGAICTPTPSCPPTVNCTPTPTRTPTPSCPVGANCTPTPTRTPSPRPTNPPPNGTCEKTGQAVPFQGAIYDLWKCRPVPPTFRFTRVDIFVGVPNQEGKLDPAVPPLFDCQSDNQIATGFFKGYKKNVNPGTNLPHHEVWSANFDAKCVEGVNVYIHPRVPTNHPVIQLVAFTNTTAPTATPTPRRGDGDVDKNGHTNAIDAALVQQQIVGLFTLPHPDNADVNRSGRIDAIDTQLILQLVAGLIPHLPI